MKKTSKLVAAALVASLVLPAATFAKENSNKKEKRDQTTSEKTKEDPKTKKSDETKKNSKDLAGSVVSISGNTISLNSNGTTYSVDASSAKIMSKYGLKLQIFDVKTGDNISVQGKVDGTNVSAKTIRDLSIQTASNVSSGKVTAINGTSFTLQINKKNSRTINTNNSTVITKNGQPAQFSNIAVGSTVKVSGIFDKSNNTVTAQKINIIIKTVHISFFGIIGAKNGSNLTVTGYNGTTYTVDLSRAVVVRKYKFKAIVSDLNVGDKVQVKGKHEIGSISVTAYLVKDYSVVKPDSTPTPTPSTTPTPTPSPTPTPTPTPTP